MRNFVLISILAFSAFLVACKGQKEKQGDSQEGMAADSTQAEAKEEKKEKPRKSPKRKAEGTLDGVKVTITYGSPQVRERTIWGELVPYGELWRTGANEATTIEFGQDVIIKEKTIPAGKYALFTIPQEKGEWTLILNENWDQWGTNDYEESKDVARLQVQAMTNMDKSMEAMTFVVQEGVIFFVWDNKSWVLPIQAAA